MKEYYCDWCDPDKAEDNDKINDALPVEWFELREARKGYDYVWWFCTVQCVRNHTNLIETEW